MRRPQLFTSKSLIVLICSFVVSVVAYVYVPIAQIFSDRNVTLGGEHNESVPDKVVRDSILGMGTIEQSPSTLPLPSPSDIDETTCTWWSHEVGKNTDTECGVYALRRMMGADTILRAQNHARACALLHGAECVLSHEIGFKLPAVLVWNDARLVMKMYLLPKIFAPSSTGNERRIALSRPSASSQLQGSDHIVHMNRTIEVEYVDTQTRRQVKETLNDTDAYCLQLLKYTVPDECSEGL